MAIKIKSADQVVAKWKTRASGASADYTTGVQNPRAPWAASTAAAADTYNQGVQQAISNGRFVKGVAKAGDGKWLKGATEKGPARYSEGVNKGTGNYQSGVAPYLSTLANISLPPRAPKGDPRNTDRVTIITQTLRNQKIQGNG